MVHRRKVGGETLIFGHAGKLYFNSFVMYDKKTNSEWVHVTGECAKGKLAGRKLEFLPSKVLLWPEWKRSHPETDVLAGEGRDGFMGAYVGTVARGNLGFHVPLDGTSKLYSFTKLETEKVINDTFKTTPLVVAFSKQAATATAWDRRVGGRVLTFKTEEVRGRPMLQDEQTGSLWDSMTGTCMEGKLKDQALKALPGVAILLSRWRSFYPDGELHKP